MSKLRRQVQDRVELRLRNANPARRMRTALAAEQLLRWGGSRSLHVLDAGCELGLLSIALGSQRPHWTMDAVDLDQSMLDVARIWVRDAGVENVELRRGDLLVDLPERRYDAAVALECLSQIPDPDAALRALHRSLVPGGRLVLHVPEATWQPILRGSPRRWTGEVHHGWRVAELREQLSEVGFDVASVTPTTYAPVQLAQEVRDRVRRGWLPARAAVGSVSVAAVALERAGVTPGSPRGLFAVADRRT